MQSNRLVAVQLDGAWSGPTWPPFSAPTLIPGLASRTTNLHDPTLTADELEMYLSSDIGTGADIWSSVRATATAPWSPAVAVPELSSTGIDLDPDISPDGLTLYLSSDRSGESSQLYVSHRSARGRPWDPPQLMQGFGSTYLNLGPSVDPAGLFMVFASDRQGGELRLFSASRTSLQGTWDTIIELSAINSGLQDQNPALFNQERSLIWSSRRSNQGATSDLFEVSRPSAAMAFSGVVALAPLNTATDWEGDAWVSQDGHHIVFVSDRASGTSQIWEAWR